jgi:hypothetical protein
MRQWIILGLAGVVSAATGCGGSSADSLMKDELANMKDVASILEGIKDDSSAEAALPKLEKAADRAAELSKKAEALKLSDEQKKQLEARYKTEAQGLSHKVFTLMTEAQGKAPQKAKQLQALMPRLGYAQTTFATVGKTLGAPIEAPSDGDGFNQMMSAYNDALAALKGIKDEASAKEAEAKLRTAADKLQASAGKLKKFTEPQKKQSEKIGKQLDDEMNRLAKDPLAVRVIASDAMGKFMGARLSVTLATAVLEEKK